MVGISRDVTRRARVGAASASACSRASATPRDEAERQSRLKDEFLATLSHELRTPMNVILGWLDDPGERQADPRRRSRRSAVIQRNAQMQAKLIDDLLDMNRLMSGNVQLELGAGRCRRRASGDDPEPPAGGRCQGRAADRVRSSRRSSEIAATRGALQQVLWNLLHNAIKFTPSGGRVEVRAATRSAEDVQIAVEDNGQGISPSFLPHVFERFRQEDASTTREPRAGSASACRSPSTSWSCTAGRSPPTVPATGVARPSPFACRPLRAR